ncbi:MAG: DNA-dirted polymerase [Clostridiaceae bacterium]|jgi:hypothetical protein|nr:DNA-dirted polymerase [Clostridiaceae bacterium]
MAYGNYGQDNPNESMANDMAKQVGNAGKSAGKKVARKIGKKVGGKIGKTVAKAGAKIGKIIVQALIKSLIVVLPYLLIGLIVLIIALSGYYYLFEIRGPEQSYTLGEVNRNETKSNPNGYFTADKNNLSPTNKGIIQFYQSMSKKSYWQITGSNNSNISQPIIGEDAVVDYYEREGQFLLHSDLLYSLDEYMFKGKFKYPEQFIKPVKYNENTLELDILTDDKSSLKAQSTKYNEEGIPTDDKTTGVWDYGIASVYKYEEKKRELKVEGTVVYKDFWDVDEQRVYKVAVDYPFSYTMKGYPQDIWLMNKAVTFVGEHTWTYDYDAKQEVKKLTDGETENKEDDATKYHYASVVDKAGNVHYLYEHRKGSVFEYVPAIKDYSYVDKGDKYFRDYMYNFKTYLPENVMFGLDFTSRIGTILNTNLDVGTNANSFNSNYTRTLNYRSYIEKYSKIYGADPALITAMIAQESGGKSNINEDGLMQITNNSGSISAKNLETGNIDTISVTPENKANPELNIAMGVMIFVGKMNEYEGDALKALQSYNFGVKILKEMYPESWDTLDWMNYREEAREYYGRKELGVETRSINYSCAPQLDKNNNNLSVYGDVCYIENVMRYYNGNAGYEEIENHDQETGWEKLAESFNKIFNPEYDKEGKHTEYYYPATPMEVNWALKTTTSMQSQSLFSQTDNDNIRFWETGFMMSYGSQGMSYDDLSKLAPGVDGYTTPLGIKNPVISSPFGNRPNPFGGSSSVFHRGIDVALPVRTPIYAIADGTVEVAVNVETKVISLNDKSSYGKYITIKHNDGTKALYAHLDVVDVQVGDKVTRGQGIGGTGNSGASTGPHLHFEFQVNNQPVDPYYIVNRPELFKN